MTFGESYLKHLEVLQNVGMTRIDEVEFEGKKIVPIQVPPRAAARSRRRSPRTTPARRRSAALCEGIKDGKPKRYFIYNICDHAETYKEPRAGGVVHDRRAGGDRRRDDGDRQAWKGAGVFNMEQLDPDPFLADVGKRGLPWHVEERSMPDQGTARRGRRARDRHLAARDAVLRHRSRRARGEPAAPRRRPAARGLHDPARAQGLRAVVDVPARQALPRAARRRARSPRRGSRAKSSAARSTPTRPRTRRRDARARHARRSHRPQLARAVAPPSRGEVERAGGKESRSACASTTSIRRSRSRSTIPPARARGSAPRARTSPPRISTASTACTSTRCVRSTAMRSSARSPRSSRSSATSSRA